MRGEHMSTQVDFAELVERARNMDDHVPEGWVQTDNLEVIPEIGTSLVVNFASVERLSTQYGYPRIQRRALDPETGLSFFDHLNWSDSDQGNQITLQTLVQLGVPSSVVDAGLDAIVDHLMDSYHFATIHDHNQRDTRTFPRIYWNRPNNDEDAGEVAELIAKAKAKFTTGEVESNSDMDW